MTQKQWKPVPVNDVQIAFGGDMKLLLPETEEIPKEFFKDNNIWVKKVEKWFYKGVTDFNCEAKEGIDAVEAIRHIHCILKSFQPKHEHKIAGCAFLLNTFFAEFDTFNNSKK